MTRRRPIAAAAALLLGGGILLHALTQVGSAPDLRARIAELRSLVDRPATDAADLARRAATLVDWGSELQGRTNFTPQVLPTSVNRLMRANLTAASIAAVAQWTRILGFVADNYGRTGTFERLDRTELRAGEYATIALEYTLGDVEIPAGSTVRLGYHFLWDAPRWQTSDPRGDAWVSFRIVGSGVSAAPTTVQWESTYGSRILGVVNPDGSMGGNAGIPALRITSGALRKGDRVIITVGDTSQGSRGCLIPTRDSDDLRIPLEGDVGGAGTYVPLGFVRTTISANRPARINAVAPSVVAAGEPFALRLRVEDQYRNPAHSENGLFTVSLNGKALGGIRVTAGSSTASLEGIKIAREGAYRFDVRSADGTLRCASSPVLVEHAPRQRVYWGETHGHSGWEDGYGSVPGYYRYARDVAFLDFGSLTGHDVFLLRPGWDQIRLETGRADRPGSFVAFMGYEWSQPMSEAGGHHNVLFKNDPGRYVTVTEAPRAPLLFEKLKALASAANVLVIPHAHSPGDWNYGDAEIQPLVEIHSIHGSFEYFGQRFLARGWRMGFVGGSDDHGGHPGYSAPLISTFNGLAAVYAPKLERDSIWRGLKDRMTYATSGERIVVQATLGGEIAGGAVRAGGTPTIAARVLGTAPIDHIDVMHNGQVEYSRDYLRTADGANPAVEVLFHSPTETPGAKLMEPRTGVYWRGWIEIDGGRLGSIEGLGLDHWNDEVRQVDDHKVWFSCKTRGDFDGVMLRLASAPADTRVTVRIAALDAEPPGQGGLQTRFPGPPPDTALHEFSFRLAEVRDRKANFKLRDDAIASARTANFDGSWDVSFRYRPTRPPAESDYYYLRVVQIDGASAWTSPVWIGGAAASKN